jgi:hypothetical protein
MAFAHPEAHLSGSNIAADPASLHNPAKGVELCESRAPASAALYI